MLTDAQKTNRSCACILFAHQNDEQKTNRSRANILFANQKDGKYLTQRTDRWIAARLNMITATTAIHILCYTNFTDKYKTLKDKIQGYKNIINGGAIEWGSKLEPCAVANYENITKNKVHEIGLVRHKKYTWLGASPDGLCIPINGLARLLEIKCPKWRKPGAVPYYYWVQMQIQMEVCDVDFCDYFDCEFIEADLCNNTVKPASFNKILVNRDSAWFASVIGELENCWKCIQYYKKNGQFDIDYKNNCVKFATIRRWEDWVSVTSVRNYIIDDPFSDWAKLYKGVDQQHDEFQKFLHVRLNKFKCDINQNIKNAFECAELSGKDMNKRFLDTCSAIKSGKQVIIGATIFSDTYKIYGVPDLLVRTDCLENIKCAFNNNYWPIQTKKRKRSHPSENKYCVFILQNKKLVRLTNGELSSRFKYEKTICYLYSKILGDVQNCENTGGFILGTNIFSKHNALHYAISKVSFDHNVRFLGRNAIRWIRQLRNHGAHWTVNPPSVPELYPNMNVNMTVFKEKVGRNIGEITQLWMCGVKNRQHAHANGIYNWREQKCKAIDLNVRGKSQAAINAIIKINLNPPNLNLLITPPQIKSNVINWKNITGKKEMYVDFETISGMFGKERIFMIGAYFNNSYEMMVVDSLTDAEEKRIIVKFSKMSLGCLVYHWGHIENSLFKKKCNEHNISCDIQWMDILKLFREEPIAVHGSLNYGLKSIARAFYNNKFIDYVWEDSPIANGTCAMTLADKIYKEIELSKKNVKSHISMEIIKKYNMMDCRVLFEILLYLRKFHA
jgi:putative phage-type endonuclease